MQCATSFFKMFSKIFLKSFTDTYASFHRTTVYDNGYLNPQANSLVKQMNRWHHKRRNALINAFSIIPDGPPQMEHPNSASKAQRDSI